MKSHVHVASYFSGSHKLAATISYRCSVRLLVVLLCELAFAALGTTFYAFLSFVNLNAVCIFLY